MYKKIKSPHGFYSASPLPSPEELKEHYSSKYYEAPKTSTYQVSYSAEELKHKKLRAELNIHAISKVSGSLANKTIFEIGFGEGFILQEAANQDMKVSGVDFTDSGLKSFHPDLLPKVYIRDAYSVVDDLIEKKEEFDVCVIQNVLEHVLDPDAMINRIKAILKTDGLLVVNVPNDYSALQLKAIETGIIDREFWFGPIEHLHYFNTENLPDFISYHGFNILDAYGDFPIDLFLMNTESNYIMDKSKGKSAHNARVTIDLLLAEKGLEAYHKFCQALSGVSIGRNICLIAQKKEE